MSCMQPSSGIFREKESNRLNNVTTFQKPVGVTCPVFVFHRIPIHFMDYITRITDIAGVTCKKKEIFIFLQKITITTNTNFTKAHVT